MSAVIPAVLNQFANHLHPVWSPVQLFFLTAGQQYVVSSLDSCTEMTRLNCSKHSHLRHRGILGVSRIF